MYKSFVLPCMFFTAMQGVSTSSPKLNVKIKIFCFIIDLYPHKSTSILHNLIAGRFKGCIVYYNH